MVKIFAIYSKVKLLKKPEWLDGFRKKYDKPYVFHITLKQPSYIQEKEIKDIRDKLSKVIKSLNFPEHEVKIVFDKIKLDKVKDDNCIMIKAKKNKALLNLQKRIRHAMRSYNNFCDSDKEEYEKNFVPHITIGRHLSDDKYQLAKKDLKDDFLCAGIITEVYLSVVNKDTVKEAKNQKNHTIYKL